MIRGALLARIGVLRDSRFLALERTRALRVEVLDEYAVLELAAKDPSRCNDTLVLRARNFFEDVNTTQVVDLVVHDRYPIRRIQRTANGLWIRRRWHWCNTGAPPFFLPRSPFS